MKWTPVSGARAHSVQGATEGFCDATTSNTPEYVNLTAYKQGYVKIYCENDDHYIAFGTATGFVMQTGAQAVGTAGVVDRVPAGAQGYHVVVPKEATWLGYRTVAASATGTIRVIPC